MWGQVFLHNLTLPMLTESITSFRTRKLPKTQVNLKITVVGESFKQKTIIVSVASDTFEFTWNISKRGRKDENILKRGRRFEIRSNNYKAHGPFAHERTIQFNSDVATSRRPHKHGNILLLFAWAKEGDKLKTNTRSLTALICIHWKEPNTQRIIAAWPWRIILRIHFEMLWIVDLRFRCLTAIFFLLELRKSNICFRGSIIQDNGHNVVREHLLLLARI